MMGADPDETLLSQWLVPMRSIAGFESRVQ
jgi:hypothetical protein